ncbi:MAG TPA: hypothetical protein VMU51_34710 [Mycobacteriales bacterium]|nr:hypothetical protein [Mycobacteriales bacterium]
MTDQLERDLRAALERLGDRPPPLGLTEGALRRARRARTARWTAAAAGTAGLTAAVVFAAAALTGPPAATPVVGSTAAVAGAGGRVVTLYGCDGIAVDEHGRTVRQTSLVLDRAAGRYREVPYCGVVPSPDGRLALVSDGDGSAAHPLRNGVLTIATGATRWIHGYTGTGSWSPDSQRLLLTGGPAGLSQQASLEPRNNGFVLVNVATLTTTFHPVPDVPNGLGAAGAWTPDGQAIAITICACPSGSTHEGSWPITGIRLYDPTGRQLRTLRADAGVWSTAAFSPDGASIALTAEAGTSGRPLQIADARTGQVRQTVPLNGGQFLGWYDATRLILRAGEARTSYRPTYPELRIVDLVSGTVRTVPARLGQSRKIPAIVLTGPSTGLTDPTGKLTF